MNFIRGVRAVLNCMLHSPIESAAGSRYKLRWDLCLPYSGFAVKSGMSKPGISQLQKLKKYFSKNFEAWMNAWYNRRGASGLSEKRVFLAKN
jgi:hypothetical protein